LIWWNDKNATKSTKTNIAAASTYKCKAGIQMTRITGALFTAPPPNQKKRGVQGIKDATESKNVKLD
jgi:hypothetical protein